MKTGSRANEGNMRGILFGALCGFAAWLVYGCVETVLSLGLQWVRDTEMAMMGWQWPLIALVLGIYAAAGVALGAGVAVAPAAFWALQFL